MNLNYIVVHEIIKAQGDRNTDLRLTNELLPFDNNVSALAQDLVSGLSSQRIIFAVLNEQKQSLINQIQHRFNSNLSFLKWTVEMMNSLKDHMSAAPLSSGAYVVFMDYQIDQTPFTGIYLIRDRVGQSIKWVNGKIQLSNVQYLDIDQMAMGCKIDISKWQNLQDDYVTLTTGKSKDVSEYFQFWLGIDVIRTMATNTRGLFNLVTEVDLPFNPETGEEYTIDQVRNMVYEYAASSPKKEIDLMNLGERIYGDPQILTKTVENNNLSIATTFNADTSQLKKFVELNITKDQIALRFRRVDLHSKVRLSNENPNMLLIESEEFVKAFRLLIHDTE